MEKFIAYEKPSKKKQRELNAKRRSSWGGVNPVTRKPANPKAYNRVKARNELTHKTNEPLNIPTNLPINPTNSGNNPTNPKAEKTA